MTAEILNEQPRDSEYESGYKKGVNDTIKDYRERRRKELAEIQDRDKRLGEMAEALDRIANPLKWMQKDLKEGYALNGQMAVELSNNPAHLKNIAEIALKFYEEYKKPKQ